MNTSTSDIFPKDEDILFGRGGRTNHHPGNKRLREIANSYRFTYHQAKKTEKPKVSKLIVAALRTANPPSRFLRMNDDTNLWEDVGDRRAAEKVSQTLREKDKAERMECSSQGAAQEAIAVVAPFLHTSTSLRGANLSPETVGPALPDLPDTKAERMECSSQGAAEEAIAVVAPLLHTSTSLRGANLSPETAGPALPDLPDAPPPIKTQKPEDTNWI